MEIKVQERGIFKRIPKDIRSSVQLEDMLAGCFEEEPGKNIFAHFSAANGYYIWTLPGKGWLQLSKAGPDEDKVKIVLKRCLEEVRASLRNRTDINVSEDMIDKILSVPSDDYVYYRSDLSGNTEIKLVAWDYQFPAVQNTGASNFKTRSNVPKQSVVLKFIEAGKPVAGYPFLVRSQGGRFADKKTTEDGTFPMPNLVIGSRIEVCSKDRMRDFSFTVKQDESEYVHDITGPVSLLVSSFRDGRPCVGENVRVLYLGRETSLEIGGNGKASIEIPYRQDAEVIAETAGENRVVKVDYPVTDVRFELHTPMAEIVIYSTMDGRPSEGDVVTVNIPGYESFTGVTDSDGCFRKQVLFRPDAGIAASLAGEVVEIPAMQMSNTLRFDRNSPAPQPEPVPVPEPAPEYYNIFLRCNKGPFPGSFSVSMYQNNRRFVLEPDADGKCVLEKGSIESGTPVTAIFTDSSTELGRMSVTFETSEDDYELNLNLKKKIYPWDIILQIFVAILAFVFFSFVLLILLGLLAF